MGFVRNDAEHGVEPALFSRESFHEVFAAVDDFAHQVPSWLESAASFAIDGTGGLKPPRITSGMVHTSTSDICVFEAGEASDLPALLLLPGLFCSAESLIEAMLPLARRTKLVAVEWRGHGRSVAEEASLEDLACDAMAVIRRCLPKMRICVLGHSMGARVFWAVMRQFRSEMDRVLAGVAVFDHTPGAAISKAMRGPSDRVLYDALKRDSQQIRRGKQQMVQTLIRLWGNLDDGFIDTEEGFSDWLEFASECKPSIGASLHWESLTSDYTAVAQSVVQPVLVVVGGSTLAADSIYQRFGASMPAHGAHFAVIPGGRHCLHLQPELLPNIHLLVEDLLHGSLEPNFECGRDGNVQPLHKSTSRTKCKVEDNYWETMPLGFGGIDATDLLNEVSDVFGQLSAQLFSTKPAPSAPPRAPQCKSNTGYRRHVPRSPSPHTLERMRRSRACIASI